MNELVAQYLLGEDLDTSSLSGPPSEEDTERTMREVMAIFGAAGAAGTFTP